MVGSPRELYPQVLKNIINITYNLHDFLFYINVIISYSFKSLQTTRSPGENEKRDVLGHHDLELTKYI